MIDAMLARDAGDTSRIFRISQRLLEVQGEYYDQLACAQHGERDITDWIAWFAEQFRLACVNAAAIIDLSLTKGRFWENHAEHSLTVRQRKVLNILLDAGPGGFTGAMSTKKYQSIAGTSRATNAEPESVGLLAESSAWHNGRPWIGFAGYARNEHT